MRLSKNNSGTHTLSGLTDDDLRMLYSDLCGVNDKLSDMVRQHLIDHVTDRELTNYGVETPEEYIDNYLS